MLYQLLATEFLLRLEKKKKRGATEFRSIKTVINSKSISHDLYINTDVDTKKLYKQTLIHSINEIFSLM